LMCAGIVYVNQIMGHLTLTWYYKSCMVAHFELCLVALFHSFHS
jgi:hypothetical protein